MKKGKTKYYNKQFETCHNDAKKRSQIINKIINNNIPSKKKTNNRNNNR